MSNIGQIWIGPTPGIIGWVIRTVTRSTVNHAKIAITDDLDIGAEPHGARIRRQIDYQGGYWSRFALNTDQAKQIAHTAVLLENTGYNYVDDALIPLTRWFDRHGIPYPQWLKRHIESTRTLQCAQLVDLVYQLCDIQLFDDGRLPGSVYPGSFEELFIRQGWMPEPQQASAWRTLVNP